MEQGNGCKERSSPYLGSLTPATTTESSRVCCGDCFTVMLFHLTERRTTHTMKIRIRFCIKFKNRDIISKVRGGVFLKLQPATIQITTEMKPYINTHKSEIDFKQRALLLYPFIQNNTLSHGRAAEILGINKWTLIQLYGSMGIPYIDMDEAELSADIENAMTASI